MHQSIIELLICPVCRAEMALTEDGRSCVCHGTRRHCFDLAKSGYLNLNPPTGGSGDERAAIRARTCFLEAGYYRPLADRIGEILCEISAQSVLDAGCGEGYYTNLLSTGRRMLGVDLSKSGIESAAKSAKARGLCTGFAVSSLFTLPVRDGSFDAILNIFAPCAEKEFARALRDGGYLLLVGAGERHLMGLKQQLYENAYENPGRADLPEGMTLVRRERLAYTVTVRGQEHIQALFSMTPYYWRTSAVDRAKLDPLETLETELDFDLFLYQSIKKGS